MDLNKTHDLVGLTWVMKPEVAIKYQKALDTQLDMWLNGINVHTCDLPEGLDPECCPDFSCCCPNLAWPQDLREKFVAADAEQRESMLHMGVNALIEDETANVHVAGSIPS